jgi:hypothetical protein
MRFRKLRIALSATCLIACVLLIVLWVRSYWFIDIVHLPHRSLVSMTGRLFVAERIDRYGTTDLSQSMAAPRLHFWGTSYMAGEGSVEPIGIRLILPLWFAVTVAGLTSLTSAMPWLHWRYTLRTLLIVTTLVAIVLGLLIYAARN